MNISYNWLRELIELNLPPEALRERLTMRGLEVESVERHGDDYVLEVAVLSNRADLLSHLGVAREVAVMTDGTLRLLDTTAARVDGATESFAAVEIQDADLCPRYAARVVRGVRVGPSPAWLAERLLAVGQRPINNVADITNFVMLETGQPLHAFDLEKLAERRIVVRRARAGETLVTLDGVERALTEEMLVIADGQRPVALAGLMGGADSEISAATRDVLVESAYFDPASVRRTARALAMQTDASDRFERGTDYEQVVRAQARSVALICELAGGTATADALDVYPQPVAPAHVRLRFRRVRELTGLPVEPTDALRILNALGFKSTADEETAHVVATNGAATVNDAPAAVPAIEEMDFVVPAWRRDVQLEEDLIEEVGRHFGYEHVADALPASNATGEYRAGEERRRAARRALTACGYDEAVSFSFIAAAHDGQFDLLPLVAERVAAVAAAGAGARAGKSVAASADGGASPTGDAGATADTSAATDAAAAAGLVTLSNPLAEGAERMRPTLLPGLLAAVRHNFNHGTRDVSLYEIGRVFAARRAGEERPLERNAWALVTTGGVRAAGHADAPRAADFYDLKGALEAAIEAMNVGTPDFAPVEARHLRSGQAAQVSLAGQAIGTLGRLADELAAAYKFRQPVYVAELDFDALVAAPVAPARYAPLPRYPSVVRDVSLLVARRHTFAALRRAALELKLDYCRSVELADVYEGERLPEGTRSVTLRVEYRAPDRTLRDEEVDALHAQIVAALVARFDAQQR
ncbi:MAG TPA: phenylalanine--tRNA ligase subunit beta [Pyrinomonadaceae bacterium]|jgi:phenylalanyl-tRNA synthetase beta chain